jgi:hypothetical protein
MPIDMKILCKPLANHGTLLNWKDMVSNDRKSVKKYPEGPNKKQGYPDEKQPNKDDLHQDHMIENKPGKEKKKPSNLFFVTRDTFKGWSIVF